MTRSKPAVGVKRDIPELLGGRGSMGAEQAIAERLLFRAKIQGQWLYSTEVDLAQTVSKRMKSALEMTLCDWLIGKLVMVSGNARKRVAEVELSSGAAQQLTKDLLQRSDLFRGLGLQTQNYQPHLAIYGSWDEEEVERQLQAATDLMERRGQVEPSDLPDPLLRRQLTAWRWVVLEHLEFRGDGWLDGSTLRSW